MLKNPKTNTRKCEWARLIGCGQLSCKFRFFLRIFPYYLVFFSLPRKKWPIGSQSFHLYYIFVMAFPKCWLRCLSCVGLLCFSDFWFMGLFGCSSVALFWVQSWPWVLEWVNNPLWVFEEESCIRIQVRFWFVLTIKAGFFDGFGKKKKHFFLLLYLLPFPSLLVLWMNIYEVGCSAFISLWWFSLLGLFVPIMDFSTTFCYRRFFFPLQYSQFFCWLFGSIETRIFFFSEYEFPGFMIYCLLWPWQHPLLFEGKSKKGSL